ncbi:DUF4386 domain-containing protein [Flagellimonas sp.]|uniref:DUF4386 domain-containing protein n=1 Tax=Flagellimonas sp. TaxID=2058762 RepID=UPI003F4A0C35
MQSNIKIGRITGVLLFTIVALGIPAMNLRNLFSSMAWTPSLLEHIFENTFQIRISIFLDLVVSGLWLSLAIWLFPVIKQFRKGFAYWFLGIWTLHFAVVLFGLISELSLLSLADVFANSSGTSEEMLIGLGTLNLEEYFWSHYLAVLLFSTAMLSLYFIFYQTKLIPRFLSVWGMIAISIVFVACQLALFNIKVNFTFFGQNGVHLLVLIGWLLAKGFNTSPITLRNS